MNIAIIPARKNSKRIKNKNIKSFFGKPVISYAIKCALKSGSLDAIK
jgi:CMP-N-acetylneuraminic acid synthetase